MLFIALVVCFVFVFGCRLFDGCVFVFGCDCLVFVVVMLHTPGGLLFSN